MKLLSFLLVVLFLFSSQASLPPDAQNYLDKIPEKKLTLNFVIKAALAKSQAYRVIGLDHATADLENVGQYESMTDTVFTVDGTYSDDNSAKTNGFQPLRTKQWKWGVGFAKNWASGTATRIGWEHDTNNLEVTSTGGVNNLFITEYKQSALTIGIEQSLLKNSFGYSFRKKKQAAEARGDMIKWNTRTNLESTTLQFINQYYQSWLMQQQVTSLSTQVKRQKRLVEVMKQRARKGAVEKPDLIQIEALLAATQTNLEKSHYDLSNIWDALAISLGFPKSFLSVNPMDIPITIDNPVPLGLRVCGQKEPVKTASVFAFEKALEGLDKDFKAAKNDSLPDLKLIAGYRGNSIDGSAATTFENVIQGDDRDGFGRGPAWNVGVQFSWPLNNSGARAVRTQKYIEREKTIAQLQSEVDNLKIIWRDRCRKLKVEFENEKSFANVVKEQKKRVRAEERRFRLGRIRVNQLVDAENDLGDWEYRSQQKKVQVRLLAWEVQRYSGDMYRFLAPYVEPLLNGGAQ